MDLVRDYVTSPEEKKAFVLQVEQSFPVVGDFPYARELRNSIVHRGLNPAMYGTQRGAFVFALCPPLVHNIDGSKSYICRSPLLVDLAADCDKASNTAIVAVLEREGMLDAAAHIPDKTQTLDAVVGAPFMPEWAKVMASDAFATMDFEAMASELAQSRTGKLRSLLGQS